MAEEKKTAAKKTATKTKAKAAAEAESVMEETEAVTEAAESVTEDPEAVTEAAENVTEEPEAVTEAAENVTEEPEAVTEAAESVTEEPETVMETDDADHTNASDTLPDLEDLLAAAVPEYDEDTPLETLLAIAQDIGMDGAVCAVKTYLLKTLDGFFESQTQAEDYLAVEDLLEAETAYRLAKEDIRRITQGANDSHQPMTWREAVAHWERKHPDKKNARNRAAFFAHLGIATTSECAMLDGDGDIS